MAAPTPSLSSSRPSLNVLLMAAGTGGHVFPALAVAKQLQQEGHKVHWLATLSGMEHQLLKDTAIPIYPIDIQGVRGNGLKRLMLAPFKMMAATLATLRILKQQRIDVVIGFGGYVAGPGGFAARLMGLPLLIHEQNAIAGLTNRYLAKIATRVLQAFPNTFAPTPKIHTVGNPVRVEIAQLPPPDQRFAGREGAIRILVVGGSLGAQALNTHIPAALAQLPIAVTVRHQCGQKQVQIAEQAYRDHACAQVHYEVVPFVHKMAEAYAQADVVICRAGALTVTEIATAGCAALFIPLPIAVDDHQTANAQYLVNAGAAQIVQQKDLPEQLVPMLNTLLQRDTLHKMATIARTKGHADATQRVVQHIYTACGFTKA